MALYLFVCMQIYLNKILFKPTQNDAFIPKHIPFLLGIFPQKMATFSNKENTQQESLRERPSVRRRNEWVLCERSSFDRFQTLQM